MNKYKVIDNNILDKQSILNVLRSFIFGNEEIQKYDENKIYNTNDKVYIIDKFTGKVQVVRAITNDITGEYNPEYWVEITLGDLFEAELDSSVIISNLEPVAPSVQMWFEPKSYSEYYLDTPEPEIPPVNMRRMNLIFTDDSVPMVEDTDSIDLPEIDVGDVVFDHEGERVYDTGELPTTNEQAVDEQEDILISDTPPSISDPAYIWGDTDLTDDK